ncbi:unnamed protein product [Medioppia subpectinata]|uniref:Uncharacterized protein n=1 Tax=Medioppia subpectinata TaxID=1979941 RepID=A0A7R9Q6N0_9ACAR|nr:unnamed protein product [Medioppia subpectinata]CAG2114615.1 unnamed protein product [Medioppia subpectinata]
MIHVFDIELEELDDCVDEFLAKNTSLVDQCRQLLLRVHSHKTHHNYAKTLGTGLAGAGGLALIGGVALTPFTAGLSLIVTLGGAVATAAGTATTLGTDLVDHVITKRFFEALHALATERNESAQRLAAKLSAFDAALKKRFRLNRVNDVFDDGFGFVTLIQLLSKDSLAVYRMGAESLKLLDAIKQYHAIQAAKAATDMAGGGVAVLHTIGQTLTAGATHAFGTTLRTAGATTGKLVLSGGVAALGLVLTVADAMFLVKDWHKAHPTVEAIDALIKDLETDHQLIESIHTMITTALKADVVDNQLIDDIIKAILTKSTPKEVKDNEFD